MAQQLRTKPVHRNPWRNRLLGCVVAVVLAACGGGDPTTDSLPVAMQPTTVTGADDATMDVTPAEGWVPAMPLSITRDGDGAPALPPGMEAAGSVYRFAPLGHVGGAVEIRVPFDGAPSSAGAPRLLVTLPQEDSWSEVDAQLEGTMLRARVPALGYAVAARPLSAAGTERPAASASQPAQYLRGQLSAQPALHGNAYLLTATSPSLASIQFDYSLAKSCANPVQLRLRALVVPRPTSTQWLAVRAVNLGTRPLAARAGSERIEFALAAAENGTWVFLADVRCIEQDRVRFSVLTTLPALVVKIADNSASPESSATLGPAGGVVAGPDGVQLIVPQGTVSTATTFRVARDGTGAPELVGLNAVSPIYAVTPHGQAFSGSARVSIPLAAAHLLPAGERPLLLKAAPGGKWRIMKNVSLDPTRLAVDVDELSFFVVGGCTSINPEWVIGAVDCPGVDHSLELRLFAGPAGAPPMILGVGVNAPAWFVSDTPQTLPMSAFWKRPTGTGRTDQLALVGSPGGFNNFGFRSTWTNEVLDIGPQSGSFEKFFQVTIDPAQVPLANVGRGKTLTIRSYASYETTAFRIGVGPVTVGFEFQVDFPVLVSYAGVLPIISQQPANLGVNEGQPASFTVVAGVTPPAALTYQWSRRAAPGLAFAPIAGATAASYQVATTSLSDDGAQFQVLVCAGPNRCVTSNPATLSVAALPVLPVAPVFTLQPVNTGVAAGQAASFSVTATGTPLPRIEWQSAPAADPNNFSPVVGVVGCPRTDPPSAGPSTSAACILGPQTLGDNGRRYRAVATNSATSVNSIAATLTVNAAPVAPTITVQPTPQTTTVGGSAVFSVTAGGTAPLGYAWTLGGSSLPSVSAAFNIGTCSGNAIYSNGNATITLSGLSAGCNGVQVSVAVSNGVNPSAVSNNVVLIVNPGATAPAYAQHPQQQTTVVGGSATFGYVATGSAPLSPGWRVNGVALPAGGGAFTIGACSGSASYTSNALVLTNVSAGCNGVNITVFVSNGVGPGVLSNAASLSVNSPPPGSATVLIDFKTGIDTPQAGIAYYGGAAVLDNGTLRLLGLSALRAGSATSIAGVANLRPTPIGRSNMNMRALLYSTDNTGGNCHSGNELRAVAIYQSAEGDTWVSPPVLLYTAPPGLCLLTVGGAHTPRGFEFAVGAWDGTLASGRLTAGLLTINLNPLTDTWSAPSVTTTPITLPAACIDPMLDPGRMASVYDVIVNPLAPIPPRIAVLAFAGGSDTARNTCAATLASNGTWSAAAPVWDNGVDANGNAVFAEPAVAMDSSGNILLAGSRRANNAYELATAFLPAAGAQWQVEPSQPAFGVLLPALEFDTNGSATVLYRTQPTATDAFTTVYAARRAANGVWSARQRLMGGDGDTRLPRLSVATDGGVLAVFSYAEAPAPFQVYTARFSGGTWEAPQPLQPPGSPDARFAVAARHWASFPGFRYMPVYWRETDPGDPTRVRIMSAVPVPF